MKYLLIAILIILALPIRIFAEDIILLPIPDDKIEYGCGCGYYLEDSGEKKILFQADLEFKRPQAYLSGELVSLKPIEIQGLPVKPEVGDVFVQHYGYQDVVLYFRNRIRFVCSDEMDSCEVTEFDTEMEIRKDGKMRRRHLSGYCGW